MTVKQLNIYLKEHKFEQNEYRLPKKSRQIEFVHIICFIKTERKIKKTSAGLRQAEESSDSETEDVVAELKSLSDSDTESKPDIPCSVERRTSFGRTRGFSQKYMDFFS